MRRQLRQWKKELVRLQQTVPDSNPFKAVAVEHVETEIAHLEHILENY